MDKYQSNEENNETLLDMERELIEVHKKMYLQEYPCETIDLAQVIYVDNIREAAIKTYKEFLYPYDYIESVDKYRASWESTAGLTIFNKTMGQECRILISRKIGKINTFLHENTHINDHYAYCTKHNYMDLSFIEFLKVPDFEFVYLLSEYRAFYRETKFLNKVGKENASSYEGKRIILNLHNKLEDACNRTFEEFQYTIISFLGKFAALLELYPDKMNELESYLKAYDERIDRLKDFLNPLVNIPFINLEPQYEEFSHILNKFIKK